MKCSICQLPIVHPLGAKYQGNNALPVNAGRCCDACDDAVVTPARINMRLSPPAAAKVAWARLRRHKARDTALEDWEDRTKQYSP
jgi:hypothetical protein